jgi:hypothetical protein
MLRPMHRIFVALGLAAALIGCQSEVLQPQAPRPATDPATVKLYQDGPKRYEDLGFVESAGDLTATRDVRADAVVNELRIKAAGRGANGLLLQAPAVRGSYRVGAYYDEQYFLFPVRTRPTNAVIARAIYVLKE